MYFAEYFDSDFRPLVGDRSVYILDGRNNSGTMIADAQAWGKRQAEFGRGHAYFQIKVGETFTRSTLFLLSTYEV